MSLTVSLDRRVRVDTPFLRIEEGGEVIALRGEVTTVGRGLGADIRLDDPSVSRLHAEIVRRGPYVYVADLGLSRNGTRVNGRPIARRVLDDGDVLTFGSARGRGTPLGGSDRRGRAPPLGRARADPPRARRADLAVPSGAVGGRVHHPRHAQADRRRPGGDGGGGQAAPAPAVREVPGAGGNQPARPAGQRGHRARAGPAARRVRLRAGAARARCGGAATPGRSGACRPLTAAC